LGKFKEAKSCATDGYEIKRKFYGENNINTAESLYSLTESVFKQNLLKAYLSAGI
jgi:hypothetical protein